MNVEELPDQELARWLDTIGPLVTYSGAQVPPAHPNLLIAEAARRLREFGHDDNGWPLWACPGCGKPLGESDQFPGEKVCGNCDYHSGADEEY
jgi:hypothetical protein